MKKEEFYLLIDDICGLKARTIVGDELLDDSNLFDSLAMLGLIAMFDKKFNLNFGIDEIREVGTVHDLFVRVMKLKEDRS